MKYLKRLSTLEAERVVTDPRVGEESILGDGMK